MGGLKGKKGQDNTGSGCEKERKKKPFLDDIVHKEKNTPSESYLNIFKESHLLFLICTNSLRLTFHWVLLHYPNVGLHSVWGRGGGKGRGERGRGGGGGGGFLTSICKEYKCHNFFCFFRLQTILSISTCNALASILLLISFLKTCDVKVHFSKS